MTSDALVQIETALGGCGAIVRLDRPRALNALNGDLLDALDAALDTLAADREIRVVVLTGGERCFSAGADLKEVLPDRLARVRRMHALALRLERFRVPTIAAIEGWALGGGLELAMGCTFRTAAPGAGLGLPEVQLGVIPSYGGTQLLTRLLGPGRALEMLCWGDPVDAAQAQAIGLVNWLAECKGGALALALERAAALAERSPEAVRGVRQAVRGGACLPLEQGLAVEESVIAGMIEQGDASVARDSFLARSRKDDGAPASAYKNQKIP